MRGLLVVVLLAACGGNRAQRSECADGDQRECYGGPDGTAGAGPCRTGLELCSGGRWPGICVGDVVPLVEQCNQLDDNCNGVVDDVAEAGDPCTAANGCAGTRMCDDRGRVRCVGPAPNECDVCGGPEVADLGDECVAAGCVGARVCASDGRGSQCNAPAPNECGVCGGPAVTGLDAACSSSDGCEGVYVCDLEGAAAICNAPLFNECLACAPPLGVTIGASCLGARGCPGANACNQAGDAALCTLDGGCLHLVISELSTASAVCSTDEFIELYNPSARTVPLAGLTLRSRSAGTGSFTRLITFGPAHAIAPHGFFLVASSRNSTGCSLSPSPGGYPSIPGNTVAPDATYAAVDLSASTGGIWLTTVDQDPTAPTDAIVIDVVGFDDGPTTPATVFEGAGPAPAPQSAGASGSIERKAGSAATATSMAAGGADVTAGNGLDTDDNATDFVAQATRVPQSTASSPEP